MLRIWVSVMLAALGACGDGTAPPPPSQPRSPTLAIVSGHLQTGEVGLPLGEPFVVLLTDSHGTPVSRVTVRFLRDGASIDSAITDGAGVATVWWTVGRMAGTELVTAQAQLSPTRTVMATGPFTVQARPGPTTQVGVTGEGSFALPNTSVDTMAATASDRFGNRVAGAPVAWTVKLGGGTVRPLSSQTGQDGIANAVWVMGPSEGENVLEVTVAGVTRRVAVTASLILPATAVAVGTSHSCALTITGAAYCWGTNSSGQLGVGATSENSVWPVRVVGSLRFSSIVAGGSHTCALTQDGSAYCWGSSYSGEVGAGGMGLFARPTPVATERKFTALAAGLQHTCGLATDQTIWCWGDNSVGQLGDGRDRSVGEPFASTSAYPAPVASAERFEAIAASDVATCAISTSASTYCWGGNMSFELGADLPGRCQAAATLFIYPTNPPVRCSTALVRLNIPQVLRSLTASVTAWCGVATTRDLICWGNGSAGPLPGAPVPVLDAWVIGRDVCARETTGAIACWIVWNRVGFPVVRYGSDVTLANIASSAAHSCALSQDGRSAVYCWGSNRSGEVGDGTMDTRYLPVPVTPGRSP